MAVWVCEGLLLPQSLVNHNNESRQPFIFSGIYYSFPFRGLYFSGYILIDLLVKQNFQDQTTILI